MSTLAVTYIVLIFLLVGINLEIHCTSISCPFEHRKPCVRCIQNSHVLVVAKCTCTSVHCLRVESRVV